MANPYFAPPPGLDFPPGQTAAVLPQSPQWGDSNSILQWIARLHVDGAMPQMKVMEKEQVQELTSDHTRNAEGEIRELREKVRSLEADKKSLEADKEALQKTTAVLQAQLAAMSAQFCNAGHTPYPMPQLLLMDASTGAQKLPGIGEMCPFAAYTSGLPPLPDFPVPETPEAPPRSDAPAALLAEVPNSTKTPPAVVAPKAAPLSSHAEALKMMREFDDNDASDVPLSPLRQSPAGSRVRAGTPSRTTLNASPKPSLTPKRTPKAANGKFTPGMKSPSITASPFILCESGGSIFGFTLRRACGCELGIAVEHSNKEDALIVTNILPGGAVEAWNKQCCGGPAAGKAVMPGDRIVKVNGVSNPEDMWSQCTEKQLLKFVIVRGDVDADMDPLCIEF
jgi:hypothetical protein